MDVRPAEAHAWGLDCISRDFRESTRHDQLRHHDRACDPATYRMKLGRETIHLDAVAFRILRFLAANPYRAYTRRRIAAAVSSRRYPIEENSLDRHVSSLRQQLGFFRDYVQSVPYIGYRFKA